MKKILQILGALDVGGAETMVMNIYRNIDKKTLNFDFVVSGEREGYYEKEINAGESKVFHIKERSESLKEHLFDLYRIVKKNDYDVIHYHTENSFLAFCDLLVCKIAGARKLVVHSHNTMDYRGGLLVVLSRIFRVPLRLIANSKLSCGEEAAIWLYGTNKNVEIIPLPVDCKKYEYSLNKQNDLKRKYSLDDKIVYAHVGSFSKVKNQLFLLDVFYEIYKLNQNSHLILVGDGEYRDRIERKIKELELQKAVTLFGIVDDVYNKLILSDCFIFPSLFEGFPTVVLEAQAAGLPCFVSDTVTNKIDITKCVSFVSLNMSAKDWANKIVRNKSYDCKKRRELNKIVAKTYDISSVVKVINDVYGV